MSAEEKVLDDFEQLTGWTRAASEGATVEIVPDAGREGMAMRIDFDLPPSGGWILVRKEFPLALPDNYAFSFDLRALAPQNHFEFKLVDPTGASVWWRKERDFVFPVDWQRMIVRRSRIQHAWGPDTVLRKIGAIEIAVSTGSGGQGSLWIDGLRFEERERASRYLRSAKVEASSSLAGHEPAHVLDGNPQTSWRSQPDAGEQWLLVDFLKGREYGGLVIDWDPEDYALAYRVEVSDDRETWKTVFTCARGNGGRDYVYMPDAESRYLRLVLEKSRREQGYGIVALTVEPFEFSATSNEFFQAVANDAPRGLYPKYFYGEQTYWTLVGVEGDDREALLNEEGALEVDKAGFTIEPFLYAGGALLGWSSVETTRELEDGYLPIPSVTWRTEGLSLKVTAFAAGEPGVSALYATYRIENRRQENQTTNLFLAIRPFQVNPPWQSLNMSGGVSLIREISFEGGTVSVNRDKILIPLTPPTRFGAARFEESPIVDFLARGEVPPQSEVSDPFGFAAGALEYRLDLPPFGQIEVSLVIPFNWASLAAADSRTVQETADLPARRREATQRWKSVLHHVDVDLPPEAEKVAKALRTALSHVLINRDGPRLQPGSRNYARSWIRDGAMTATALLEMGFTQEARQFLAWFSRFQFPSGKIPCCVDHGGADPVPENDSNGEFVYAVMEYYRYTHDIGFLSEMWPRVVKAVEYIAALRDKRATEVYRSPEKARFYGLLPESISHEGYSSRPVHSYWDGFFTLRGLKDAAAMADIVGDDENAQRFTALRDTFRSDLHASIARVIEENHLDFIPASAELADFDPSSTAIALSPVDERKNLPEPALTRTFERYYEDFRKRRDGEGEWEAFTPYEVRNVGALVRLGMRKEALEVLDFMIAHQRPREWNQWPEILWRDPKAPKFIGDMPHTWVASSFIQAVRSLFVYERELDHSLVIAAGVPLDWVTNGRGIALKRAPTHFGVLSYSLESDRPGSLWLRLSGDLHLPPGGIVVRPPLERPLAAVRVNGRASQIFSGDQAIITEIPADVVMESQAPEPPPPPVTTPPPAITTPSPPEQN